MAASIFDFNTAARQFQPEKRQGDAGSAFRDFLLNHDLDPGAYVLSGAGERVTRIPARGDKGGEKSGWYVFFDDDHPAGEAGNWRTGEVWEWSFHDTSFFTPAEREQERKRRELAARAREKELAALRDEAAMRARADWNQATECENHPYLARKNVRSHGLRILGGKLLVPLTKPDGTICSLQEIYADGKKRFYLHGEKSGASFLIPGAETTALVEGYATGASVHEATGWSVLVAFDAGNLVPVAQAWRTAHPEGKLVVCGDDDRFTPAGNRGRKAAEECALKVGAAAIFPRFASDAGEPTDWNDLHVREGLEAVRRQTAAAMKENRHFLETLEDGGAYRTLRYLAEEPSPLEWAFNDTVLMGSPFIISGAGGTGKTSFSLQLAASLAIGRPLLGKTFTPAGCGRSLVLLCEDPEKPIWKRVNDLGKQLSAEDRRTFGTRANIVSCLGQDMRMVRRVRDDCVTTPAFDALVDVARRMPELKCIILDPLNLLHGADIEKNEEAAQFFCSKLAQLGKETGAAVIVVHHSVKNSSGRGDKFSVDEALHMDTVRGSGAIVAGMRGACGLVMLPQKEAKSKLGLAALPKPGEYVAGRVSKNNYGECGEVFYLQRDCYGLLHPVYPKRRDACEEEQAAVRLIARICAEVAALQEAGKPITRRIFVRLYDKQWGVSRQILDNTIEKALFEEALLELESLNASGKKTSYLAPGPKYVPRDEELEYDFNRH